jgi:hypothetical protein
VYEIGKETVEPWNSSPLLCLVLYAELNGMAGLTDNNLLSQQLWHERASEILGMACNTTDAQERTRLIKVARAYERLATRAEDWNPERDSHRAALTNV